MVTQPLPHVHDAALSPRRLRGLGALVLALSLGTIPSGCSGGGGGSSSSSAGSSTPTGQLNARVTAVLTDAPQLGHALEVETEISSLLGQEDVTVSYYIVSSSESDGLDEGGTPERQQLVGSVRFPVVQQGIHTYSATLVLPEDIDDDPATVEGVIDDPAPGIAGERFQLFATVDPLNQIPESDESDNHPEPGESHEIVLDDLHRDDPDFVLRSFVLDTHTVFLEDHDDLELDAVDGIHDEEDHHLGATIEFETMGAHEQTVDVSVWIKIPGAPNNPQFALGEAPEDELWPLQIWDSGLEDDQELDENDEPTVGEFTRTYELVGEPGRKLSTHLELLIPTADMGDPNPDPNGEGEVEFDTFQALVDAVGAGENYFELRAYIDWDGSTGEWEDPEATGASANDNLLHDTIYVLPADFDPDEGTDFWQAEESYTKEWSSSSFGAGLGLEAIERIDGYGGLASLTAATPMKVLGMNFDLLHMESYARFAPQAREESNFNVDLEFATLLLYTHSANLAQYNWEWQQDVSFEKSRSSETIFWVSVVPIEVTGEIGGNLGFNLRAGIGNELELDGDLLDGVVLDGTAFVDAWATVTAQVDLLIATGGVEGHLDFLRDTFHADAHIGVLYHPDAMPPTISGEVVSQVTNELDGPSGRFYLEANYPGIKWCKGLFGVHYPCGATTERSTRNLIEWDTFHKDDVLLDFREELVSTPALGN